MAGGLRRSAVYFKPTKPRKDRVPLVIALHGHSGNGADFAEDTDFPAKWPEATIIYPDGLSAPGGQDPDGLLPGWQKNIGELGDRDLILFDELLKFASGQNVTRLGKVYVLGFSNGARMTYLLWSARPRSISAVAACAGLSTPNDLDESLVPKPAVLVHGKSDPLCNYQSAERSIKAVLAANKARRSFTGWPPGPTRNSCKSYPPLPGGADTLVITHDGGHFWPTRFSPDVVKFFQEH
jgi:polyhydroxybutyrate depolymerase